jgi:predicted ester cyclase
MPQIVTTSDLISTLEAAYASRSHDRATVLAFHAEFLGRPTAPDLPAIAARLLTADYLAHGGPAGHEVGAKALAACWRRVGQAVPDFGTEVQDVLQSGDRWVVRSIMFGTPSSRFLGLEPTGRSFSYQAIHIHRLQDGLIAETWHSEDLAGAQRQLQGR